MARFVRISALLGADVLVDYALFVMQNYLTNVWNLSFTHAAGILNFWNGISMILPTFVLFIRDQWLGNRGVLTISSIAYSAGIGFVTMSVPSVLANPCKEIESKCIGHTQKGLLYAGMALIAVGMAGNLISVLPFIAHQNPDGQNENGGNNVPEADLCQLSGFILVVIVPIVGAIALPYIKPWTLRFGIPAMCTLLATILFWSGLFWRKFRNDEAKGSPVTNICRVFVAFVYKCSLNRSLNREGYYWGEEQEVIQAFRPTRFLRFLEKAALIRPGISRDEQVNNKWKLCSVAQVEEAKIAVRMVPMWVTFIVCGMVSSFGNTYFVEQGKHLNRHLGKWNVPLAVLLLFQNMFKGIFGRVADKHLNIHKRYGPPFGIGVAMVFSILCCITAAKIEQKRLNVVIKHHLEDKPDEDIPMSIYWLLLQFFLLAGLDSFLEKSAAAFYAEQAPRTMKDYMEHLPRAVFGLGFMFNVLSVHVVGKISAEGGKKNWFQFTLNKSRLDRYYWVLSALSSVNLMVFIVVACFYRYKDHEAIDVDRPDVNIDPVEGEDPGDRQICNFCCCC